MKSIKVYNKELLLGSFEILIPEYQPVPLWNRETHNMVLSSANNKFGLDWTHIKIEEAQ